MHNSKLIYDETKKLLDQITKKLNFDIIDIPRDDIDDIYLSAEVLRDLMTTNEVHNAR